MSRELDALVAEHVMGYTMEKECFECDGAGHVEGERCHLCNYMGTKPGVIVHLPKRYSTSIAAAWEVVEKIKDYNPEIAWIPVTAMWSVELYNSQIKRVSEITAPKAICLAALKAVGVRGE